MRQGMYTGFGCGLVLVSGSALAGPPVSGHIDREAKWVLHVDLEQMASTEIGSFLMNAIADEADDFEDDDDDSLDTDTDQDDDDDL